MNNKVRNISISESTILNLFPKLPYLMTIFNQHHITWAVMGDAALWLLLTESTNPKKCGILVKEHELLILSNALNLPLEECKGETYSSQVIRVGNITITNRMLINHKNHPYTYALTSKMIKKCTTLQWGNLSLPLLAYEDLLLMTIGTGTNVIEGSLLRKRITVDLSYISHREKELNLQQPLREKMAELCS